MNHAATLANALTRPLDAGALGILADTAEEHVPERVEDVLRRLICAVPDDDGPRLRLADWWAAHGQPERGEFVRAQCELASLDDALANGSGCDSGGTAARLESLRRREQMLLNTKTAWDWMGETIRLATPDGLLWDDRITFRRGFVESLTCTAADFLQHADAILRREPVRGVKLTTWPTVGGFGNKAIHHESSTGRGNIMLCERFPGIEFEFPPIFPVQTAL